MARYEHAGRFWAITRDGSVLTLVSGKLGNKGRTVVKHHASETAALAAHQQLVVAKQAEGYRMIERDSAPALAPIVVPIADDRGAALEAAIAADPDDAEAYAVYGDWLHKHGDPRGELIALQQAGKDAGKHVATHAARLLGPLAALVPDLRVLDGPPLTWRNGFIRRAELASAKGKPLDATVGALLQHPSARFLVELALRADHRDEALQLLARLADAAPGTLRELDLFARANLDRIDAAIWKALPNLERLSLAARAYELTTLDLPRLRRARFLATSMSSASVQAIASAPWPVLERLEIRFCSVMGATEADLHDLRPLLLRTDMPALTHLRLRGAPFAGMIARTLATSPLARQLRVLDFSGGNFTPIDVAQLGKAADNFPVLEELWMPFQTINEAVLGRVAKRVISDARGPVDALDHDLAGERVPRVERYEGTRE